MTDDFERRLKAALKEAFQPFIAGMVRKAYTSVKTYFGSLDPELPMEDRENLTMKVVEKMAKDIISITGGEA